jgi:hypothetical protein
MDVYQFIKPHLAKQNLEVEFRLGKINGNTFDTNIGKAHFDKLIRRLSRYPSWDSVKNQRACIFYGLRKGLRIVYDEDTDLQTVITKHKIDVLDKSLEGMPLDVRVSVALENPSLYDPDRDRFETEKKRLRTSFIRKGLSIDMSIVQPTDKDAEDEFMYQVELEILKPSEDSDPVKIQNHYQKVKDVLKLLAY